MISPARRRAFCQRPDPAAASRSLLEPSIPLGGKCSRSMNVRVISARYAIGFVTHLRLPARTPRRRWPANQLTQVPSMSRSPVLCFPRTSSPKTRRGFWVDTLTGIPDVGARSSRVRISSRGIAVTRYQVNQVGPYGAVGTGSPFDAGATVPQFPVTYPGYVSATYSSYDAHERFDRSSNRLPAELQQLPYTGCNLPSKQWRYRISNLNVLLCPWATEEVVVRKGLEPGRFAHC